MERPRGTAPARQSAEAWHFEGRRSQKRDFWRPAGWSRRTERRARPALRSPATAPALFGAQPQYLIWVDSSCGWWAAVTAECRVVSPPRPRTHTHPPLLPSLARVPSPSRRFPTSVRPAWSCRLSQEVAATVRGGGCVFPTAALSRSLAPQGSPVTECVWGDPRGPRGGGSPQGTGLWEGRNTMGGGKGGEREETGGARPQEGLS